MKNSKNVKRLILGRSTSLFGAAMYAIALPLYILQVRDSLAEMGLYFAIASLPALMLTPIMGVFVERCHRLKLIILCDIGIAGLYLLLWILTFIGDLSIPILCISAMLINILAALFSISSNVVFTELNTPTSLERMNAMKSFFDNATNFCAPFIGTILFGFLGFSSILFCACILYTLSAIQEMFIEYQNSKREVTTHRSILQDVKEGICYVKKTSEVSYILILAMSLNFFVANMEEVIVPGILIKKYHMNTSLYGFSTTSYIIGTLLAGLYLYKNKKTDLKHHLATLFIMNSVFMILIGTFSLLLYPNKIYFPVFFILMILTGCMTTFINVPLFSFFQTVVPISMQGRFFSLLSIASSLLIPLGISTAGILAQSIGADVTYIINNVCVILLVLFIFHHKKQVN